MTEEEFLFFAVYHIRGRDKSRQTVRKKSLKNTVYFFNGSTIRISTIPHRAVCSLAELVLQIAFNLDNYNLK